MTTTTNLFATGTTGSGPHNSQNTPLSSEDTTKGSQDVSFTPTGCLFCPAESDDMAGNVSHMQQKQGLFIPQTVVGVRDGTTKGLVVDTETLLRYMHLVISGDRQCLFCQKQCRSVRAVQHHMTSRGHCRMDLDEGSDSEFLDFYEVSDDDDDNDAGVDGLNIIHLHQDLGRDTRQLSSGKVVSHRSAAPTPKPNRQPLAAAPKKKRARRGPLGGLTISMMVGHQNEALAVAWSHMTPTPMEPEPEPRAMVAMRYSQLRSAERRHHSTYSKDPREKWPILTLRTGRMMMGGTSKRDVKSKMCKGRGC